MSAHEPHVGQSSEWYTPSHVFEALGERFDLDVAAPALPTHVPTDRVLTVTEDGLTTDWPVGDFVWLNPPFGRRNGVMPWLERFFDHGNGIALTADRTNAPWFRYASSRADLVLFVPKFNFIPGPGTKAVQTINGTATTLWASGERACCALRRASAAHYGLLYRPLDQQIAVQVRPPKGSVPTPTTAAHGATP